MNTNDKNPLHEEDRSDDMPDALRWQLRGLRHDVAPQRDLWPGIAERISAQAGQAAPPDVVVLPSRNNSKRYAWLAMAASITLAVGIGWQLRPSSPIESTAPSIAQTLPHPGNPTAALIAREANAMTWEYKAALREIDAHNTPVADARALRQIDRSAALVRSALTQDPDARFLLDRLQKLYAQRLALTQRLALS